MNFQITDFLREQRHVFGTCPCCSQMFRLSETRVSYRSRYEPDWLDRLQKNMEKTESKVENFEEAESEVREKAVERARQKLLPKLLNRAVPLFARKKLPIHDIRTLLHPIDFIVFDGLSDSRREELNRILLLDSKPRTDGQRKLHESLREAIDCQALDWGTIRISEVGEVEHRQDQASPKPPNNPNRV